MRPTHPSPRRQLSRVFSTVIPLVKCSVKNYRSIFHWTTDGLGVCPAGKGGQTFRIETVDKQTPTVCVLLTQFIFEHTHLVYCVDFGVLSPFSFLPLRSTFLLFPYRSVAPEQSPIPNYHHSLNP